MIDILAMSPYRVDQCISSDVLQLAGLAFTLLVAFSAYHLSQSHFVATGTFWISMMLLYSIGIATLLTVVICCAGSFFILISTWIVLTRNSDREASNGKS